MDEAAIKHVTDRHAQAVVDPIDLARVQGDMIEELHPALPQIAQLLPQPVRSAEVTSLDVHDDHAIAVITYTGDEGSLSVQSRWEDRGGPDAQIVEAAPVS